MLALLLLLVLGTSAVLLGAFSPVDHERQRELLTRQRVAAAREALLGYAMAHGRLPRPAASALDGRETERSCSSDSDCTGYLPWVALGIAGSDGWYHLLRYSVSPEFTGTIDRNAAASKVVLTRQLDGSERYLSGQEQCSMALLCAAAVVLSTGRLNFGVSGQGVLQTSLDDSGTNLDEIANASASRRFMARPYSDDPAAPGGRYDDQVSWIDAAALLSRLNRTGLLH